MEPAHAGARSNSAAVESLSKGEGSLSPSPELEREQTDVVTPPGLDTILGLRSLSIVLSYLGECDGTSFLLTQKTYWTDTVLPCYPAPDSATASSRTKTKKSPTSSGEESLLSLETVQKKRHRFWDRQKAPLIKIPDALTRLDRLNTRRWNTRQRRRNRPTDERSHEMVARHNLTTTQLAKEEWKETTTENNNETGDDSPGDQNHLIRSTMNPPLLQFYQHPQTHPSNAPPPQQWFKEGTTCLASYPRSGNTLLRSLLETVTGFVTSSDTRPDRTLSVALAEKPPYFVGEGLAPPLSRQRASPFLPPVLPNSHHHHQAAAPLAPPPICKTHWPERIGCHRYDCQRVVLLVRNPFDATDSYWHMNLTNTHTEKVTAEVTQTHRAFYHQLVRHEILCVWNSFLDYYWKECSKKKVPLLLVRYEDLVLSPRDELQRILEFCCCGSSSSSVGGDNANRDWWTKRLEEVTRDASTDNNRNSKETKTTGRSYKYGYKSSSSVAEDSTESEKHDESDYNCTEMKTSATASNSSERTRERSTHPSIGRSLRKGLFSQELLRAIHDFDDLGNPRNKKDGTGNWLERLGYHVYKQGFPNNLHALPPVPVPEHTATSDESHQSGSLGINIPDVSLELRPRDSPYGRKMRQWRRERTARDTEPFPTI